MVFQIALYYAYVEIDEAHIDLQKEICEELSLKGRIRVAREGLNGVLSGEEESLREYQQRIETLLDITIDVKYCQLRDDLSVEDQLFKDLSIKETKEVVSLLEYHQSTSKKHSARRKRESTTEKSNLELAYDIYQTSNKGAEHLKPDAWNDRLRQVDPSKTIILDCRNVYESNVGHFQVPNTQTLLTNTRKYSELPQVFLDQADTLAQKDHVFMYCTGGVRCERASAFLKTMLKEKGSEPQIYQLEGGIQRYMESDDPTFYKGKNFVFDPRRYDPQQSSDVVGTCLVCGAPHDDYDNGNAPHLDKAARCWECRVLILVCNSCRSQVSCWGDKVDLPKMYCGGKEKDCLHTPEPKAI